MGDLKEQYEEIYQSLDYGPITSARGQTAAEHIRILYKPCKILCVGAGNSYEAATLAFGGFKVTTLDYVKPQPKKLLWTQVDGKAQKMPFKDNEFELLMCCEMLEHIPDDEIDTVMLELKRVSLNHYFTVDDADDIVNGVNIHICLHPPEWWIDKFNEWGFKGIMNKPAQFKMSINGGIAEVKFNSAPPNRGFNFYGHKVL